MREIEEIQIEDPRAICNLLQSVMNRGTPFVIHESGGTSHTAQMWAVDAKRKIISFAEDVFSPKLRQVAEAGAAVALCYVDNIKIQFNLFGRSLLKSPQGAVLQVDFPVEILQFRRRASYRVKLEGPARPTVSLTHPHVATGPIELDVIDLSEQGCGLLMSTDFSLLRRGYVFEDAVLKMDGEREIKINLAVRRHAMVATRVPKILMGCEMGVKTTAEKMLLKKYLDSFQRGRRID